MYLAPACWRGGTCPDGLSLAWLPTGTCLPVLYLAHHRLRLFSTSSSSPPTSLFYPTIIHQRLKLSCPSTILNMAADIGQIAQLLNATLDPAQHRKAEAALKQEASKPQYALTLLNIVNSDSLPSSTRLSAALAFKNFLRSNYVDEEGNYKLPLEEVNVIKERLIGLMISCPPSVQTQLGEAISTIADSDFWRKWDTLTQELVGRFSATDPKVNVGVLEVAHSIFARWRPLFRTDELYLEINHVIETFGQPFVQLLVVSVHDSST
jgi:exportin-2 (importin alpha re-exporter)